MDLTPRTLGDGSPRGPGRPRSRRRQVQVGIALAVVLGALGLVLFQGLGNATLYFRNVDEAVAQRDDLGDRRFRLQGIVSDVEEDQAADGVAFDLEWNGVTARVVHRGDPPELFEPGIPVVLEGRWDGDVFASDRMMVRHSEQYKAENPDRVPTGAP
ncbi:MAG: cytochrome c maturation protein CcmE [Acidimicrobiales bacterium]|nr:cytochrome c maturation protein CcmE [Acidimicrobiales bacterium]